MTKSAWAKWLQVIFLALPATVLLGPVIFYGIVWVLIILVSVILCPPHWTYVDVRFLKFVGGVLILSLGGALGLASLWIAILRWPDLFASSRLRGFTVLAGLSGIAAASYVLFYLISFQSLATGGWHMFLFLYPLLAPLVLGLWYLSRFYFGTRRGKPKKIWILEGPFGKQPQIGIALKS